MLIAHAREQGIEIIELQVRSDNARAIRLYEKFGFMRAARDLVRSSSSAMRSCSSIFILLSLAEPGRLYEKFGFVKIGHYPGFLKVDRVYADCDLMNLYRNDQEGRPR